MKLVDLILEQFEKDFGSIADEVIILLFLFLPLVHLFCIHTVLVFNMLN